MGEYDIFRTQIGEQMLAFDPWKVERTLAFHLGGAELSKVIADCKSADPQIAFQSESGLYAAVREAFGLPEVKTDGSGVPEKTVNRVFNEYVLWKEQLKKNSASAPTSSEPGEADCSPDLSMFENSSDSGSSANGQLANAGKPL